MAPWQPLPQLVTPVSALPTATPILLINDSLVQKKHHIDLSQSEPCTTLQHLVKHDVSIPPATGSVFVVVRQHLVKNDISTASAFEGTFGMVPQGMIGDSDQINNTSTKWYEAEWVGIATWALFVYDLGTLLLLSWLWGYGFVAGTLRLYTRRRPTATAATQPSRDRTTYISYGSGMTVQRVQRGYRTEDIELQTMHPDSSAFEVEWRAQYMEETLRAAGFPVARR